MKFFGNSRIYLDYASLTPIDRRVQSVINQYSSPEYANSSSLYKEGVTAKKALEQFRSKIAGSIHAHADEIIFTSGGTEANNLAIIGAAHAAKKVGLEKPHLIISSIEHSSVLECAEYLRQEGCEVTKLSVDSAGLISVDELRKSLKANTFLVSIMAVNNEIGTIQPLREIVKAVRHFRTSVYPLIHVDAAQAAYLDLNMEKIGLDLMTLDAGKLYGPRGVGALYIRRNVSLEPILFGGGQESGLRSGTENLPGVAGFAKALELINESKESESARLYELRSYFIECLKRIEPAIIVNGSDKNESQSPHILNIQFPKIDSEFFVLQLDAAGIACSTKSSCLRDENESYVLKAIGADSKRSIRFSIGRYTSKGEIDRAISAMKRILSKK